MQVSELDSAYLIRFTRNLTFDVVPDLIDHLKQLKIQNWILDLEFVKELDSSGLGLLLAFKCHVEVQKYSFTLVNASPELRERMQNVNLLKHFFPGGLNVDLPKS